MKKTLRHIVSFICEQYLIVFFIITIGLKLSFLYFGVLKLNWWNNDINAGVLLGFIITAILFSPLYFIRKHKNKYVILLATLISFLILFDTVYYSYFSSLPTVGLLGNVGQVTDVIPAINGLFKWWFLLYFIDIFLIIITLRYMKSAIKKVKKRYNIRNSDFKTSLIVIFLTFFTCWLSISSLGINKFFEVLERGYDTVSTAHFYGVLAAHAFDLTRFINESTTWISKEEKQALSEWVTEHKPPQAVSNLNGIAKDKNLIMIQVESLGTLVIDQKINNKEITPNLNSLVKISHYFPNDLFLYGGGHSSDTDFVANTSYFPLNDSAAFVRYGRANYTSLPKLITPNNYSTFAYHGFNRNFWNRDIAYKSLGYQKYYAADNYKKGEKINMGLSDDDFLLQTADFIKKQPKPSLSYIITLTSHSPFNITGHKNNLNINIDDYPNQVGGYIENIHYTDYALGRFFDKLKSIGLYEDSLIVVYGDHTPVLSKFTAGTINYDPSSTQSKEVPLLFKLPNTNVGKLYINRGSHLDIMPTVLDLLGIKNSHLMFGQSLFVKENKEVINCPGKVSVFSGLGDCDSARNIEMQKSSTIIRYNQFNNL